MSCYNDPRCGDRPYPYMNHHRRRDHSEFGPGFRGPCRENGRCDEFHPRPPRPSHYGPPRFY